jgi:DNA-binding NarL/FixJ family response regulator
LIRICLVDDQALIRSGLRVLLGLFDGLCVVGEAADGEAGIDLVLTKKPDVLLLDVRMPKLNGVQVVSKLAAANALPPTLLLTTFEDDAALIGGIRAGARGYLLKGVTAELLVDAITTVAKGGTYLYAPLATSPTAGDRSAAWRDGAFDDPDALTERETDVLKLMTSGISNAQIADALGIGNGTVRNHVSSIFSKLGVTDRTKAVLYALQNRLV